MSQPKHDKPDSNQTAADLVRSVTGESVDASEMFGDPKHRAEFLRLKAEDAARQARKRGR